MFINKRVYIRKSDGKKIIKWRVIWVDEYGVQRERIASTRAEADALKTRLLLEKAAGTLGKPKRQDPSFEEFSAIFLAAKKNEIKPSTYADYETVIRRHLVPFFGKERMSNIGPARIQDLLNHLEREGVSTATQGKILRYTRVIFRKAVALEAIDRDPTGVIRGPKGKEKEIQPLTPEEVNKLLESTSGDLHAMVATSCFSGLRQGELIGLQWQDIDFDKRKITISRSFHPTHGFSTPKSKASVRAIPIIEPLADILIEVFERHGRPSQDTLVFPSKAGTPLNNRNLVQKQFEPALLKAGIRRIRWHDLRHTFASLMIEGGCDPKTLQVIMGHSSITVTMNTYVNLYSTSYERAARGLEAVVSGGPKVVPIKPKKKRNQS